MEEKVDGAYAIVLCAGTVGQPTDLYTWWLEQPGPFNGIASDGTRVLWTRTEKDLRALTPQMVPSSHEVRTDPPVNCAVRQLLASLQGIDEHDASYLTTIDLLDDLSGAADAHSAELRLDGSVDRTVFTEVRNALFDGQDWQEAAAVVGAAELQRAALSTIGSIALVSTILS